jgi:Tfp pilus assembly protein PilV
MKAVGFALIEVLVATALVMVGVVSLAQAFVVSARANRLANTASMTVLLAHDKMEQLRTDANSLVSSPADALAANRDGYFEGLDARGRSVGGGTSTTVATGSVYLRRWSVEPLSSDAGSALVLQVLVIPWGERASAQSGRNTTRVPGETHFISLRPRKVG